MRLIIAVLLMIGAGITEGCTPSEAVNVFIRINQNGYRQDDVKTGIVFSEKVLDGVNYVVINTQNNKKIISGNLGQSLGTWGRFKHNYEIDFSALKDPGTYQIQIRNNKSHDFRISNDIYSGVTENLIDFFRVQRCGPTNPMLHGLCHNFDSPYIAGDSLFGKVDVTGGWHDAGDYIKFVNTAAFTTYMLLFAYDFDPVRFGFDRDNSGAPDVLEEARIGLDWLLRCNYKPGGLITQVQDLRDHEVGWRLPEDDPLRYERPAFKGIGKNIIGIYSAALALGSRIWKAKFYDDDYSRRLLESAENIYRLKGSAPDLDTAPSGMYQDQKFEGKLALGAFELFSATSKGSYLKDSKDYAATAGPDYWWSWGDVNSLAHYRLATEDPKYLGYIENNLTHWNHLSDSTVYGDIGVYPWGTTHLLFGVILNNILYTKVTGNSQFESLAQKQMDYILGKNPWGISFVSGVGKTYTKHFHLQITYLKGIGLPGGIAAGPTSQDVLKNYQIERKPSGLDLFNSDNVKYFDDRNDYITNEPTIVTNATAVFVFGMLNRK
ncbi:MAG: glycoside hydrolase family 9 protein [Ignavibacteriaceae bacterium]|nr:glycoside hydrolase family 9 protein [Ignavibacteriaceae bacterium]